MEVKLKLQEWANASVYDFDKGEIIGDSVAVHCNDLDYDEREKIEMKKLNLRKMRSAASGIFSGFLE